MAARQLTAPADGLSDMTRVASGLRRAREIVLDDLGLQRPSLDDVFLSLTGHRAEPTPTTRSRPLPTDAGHEGAAMTDSTVRAGPQTAGAARPTSSRPAWPRRSAMMVWRNLKHIRRQPEMLTDVTIQPVMFVLLFAFVFGGSIATAGVNYREWLMPGIMAQTMAFSCFIVAIGLNNDLGKGIVDRFRSLPISRSSVLIGRSIYSLIHSSIGIFVMSRDRACSSAGASTTASATALLAFALLLLFGFAMIWVGILVGSAMQLARGGQRRHVHRDLPDHLPRQHLRADRGHGPLAAHHRRVEPDQLARPGHARAVGQRPARWHPTRRCRCTIRSCRRSSGRSG